MEPRDSGAGRGDARDLPGQDIAPLQQLDTKIQSDASVQQATADYETIFTNFRVYRLVLPAAHVACDASRVTNTAVPACRRPPPRRSSTATRPTRPRSARWSPT